MAMEFKRKDLMLFDYTPEDLRNLRKKTGLTQSDVGRFFNIHNTTVHQWESGLINNQLVLNMYGIFLERYYARLKGYVPAFRKLGTNSFWEEKKNGTKSVLQPEREG